MDTHVIIPFRLREGADPRRQANLDVVQAWWYAHGFEPQIVDDGLEGDAQFNRHRAYNKAVSRNPGPDTDVFVFAEADMLIHPSQIEQAVTEALLQPGLVVPFTQYRYLSDSMTEVMRDDYADSTTERIAAWWGRAADNPASVFGLTPESTMENGTSIGAVNVVSRRTLKITGGFTELTSGNWYDDRIIEEGFAFLTGRKTRHVPGPAVHMYHLPGTKGDHVTDADRKATQRNRDILKMMRVSVRRRDRLAVKALMKVRSEA